MIRLRAAHGSLVAVQDQTVKDVDDFRRAIAAADLEKGVRLDVLNGETRRFVFLQSENPS